MSADSLPRGAACAYLDKVAGRLRGSRQGLRPGQPTRQEPKPLILEPRPPLGPHQPKHDVASKECKCRARAPGTAGRTFLHNRSKNHAHFNATPPSPPPDMFDECDAYQTIRA
eukprot:15444001-Alexandrium_andersonii.AAC.1